MPGRSADTAGSRPARSARWPRASSRSGRSSRDREVPPEPDPPFARVLVANRGEIACRIIRTLHRLGASAVAVFSDADVQAKHVREADEAVRIGEAPAPVSYLNPAAIVRAALETGCEAVHPGYGFLAESPPFSRAVEGAGLTWIGPPPEVLELTGDKVRAREAFADSGFPILAGAGPLTTTDEALTAAPDVGYPLMVKAVMGGGGIGMGIARSDDELRKAVETASARGERFFADAAVMLERYVEHARHVEVQILADADRTIHVFERECSVQRRHQKVIEEAPATALSDELRARICEAAVTSMEAIGYRGAGTVESIVAPDGAFSFLEVNARLQVEHPVTEETCGLDLVADQLRIAAGEPLPYDAAPQRRGHAIECRIYAEDPDRFLPSPGRIARLSVPEGLRWDGGYDEGDEVPMFYDPLIGKLVAYADDREHAIDAMRRGLQTMAIEGPKTNAATHLRVLEDERFLAGEYDTGLLGA